MILTGPFLLKTFRKTTQLYFIITECHSIGIPAGRVKTHCLFSAQNWSLQQSCRLICSHHLKNTQAHGKLAICNRIACIQSSFTVKGCYCLPYLFMKCLHVLYLFMKTLIVVD